MVLSYLKAPLLIAFLFCTFLLGGCAPKKVVQIEATAYCGCGKCCGWERGSWMWLKLDFWNRYVAQGSRKGRPYDGRTASGVYPREREEGFFSFDSLYHPWMIPIRIIFPWKFLPHDGTIAADTDYYPFGTRMYVPGYGWGVVEDRGSAIKGPTRIDLFFSSHRKALQWGRKKVNVTIVRVGY